MSEQKEIIAQHWDNLDKVIDRWLQERQELILLLCSVDSLPGLSSTHTPLPVKVQAFCQVLMDYMSAGHFEIYERLLSEAESFGENGDHLIKTLYPKIQHNTNLAVDFNDKYADPNTLKRLPNEVLSQDLSVLAEQLEERFEIEDHLIEVLHNRHRAMVA